MQDRILALEELLIEQFYEECFQITEDINGKVTEVRIDVSSGFSYDRDFWSNLISIIGSFEEITCVFIRIPDIKVDDLSFLSKFRKLKFIYLDVDLNCADLNPIARLSDLESLFLSRSTVDDLSSLSNLKQLNSLGLPNANIRNIEGISMLSNLREINLEGNQVEEISIISSFPFLEKIDFSKNNLTHFSTGKLSPNLRSIRLNNNQITDLTFEGVLNGSINELCISGNPVDQLFEIGDFLELEILELAHCKKLNLAGILNLRKLKHLDLEDCGLTDISIITELQELKYLNLNYNSIGDVFPLTHYDINLKVLKLRGNRINHPKDVVAFYQLMGPTLNELDLRENEFGGKLYLWSWSDREDCADLCEFREHLKKSYCETEDMLHALCFLDHCSSYYQIRLLFNRMIALQAEDYIFRQSYLRMCNHIFMSNFLGQNEIEIEQMRTRLKLEVDKFGSRMGRTLPHHFTKKKAKKLASICNESGSALDLYLFGMEIFSFGNSMERDVGIWVYRKLIEHGNPLQYVLYRAFNSRIKELYNSNDSYSTQQGQDFELALKNAVTKSFDIVAFQAERADSDRMLVKMRNEKRIMDFQIVIRYIILVVFIIWFLKVLASM